MRRATTAHSSRSARNLGKMRPLETSPTPCPARPMRCSPAVTDFGDSTWSTRSTAPMSMPSSSELVATRQGSSPALSCSSTTSRSSRASEPWCARAIGSVGQLVQTQREPLGGAAVVDEDDRRAVLAHEREQLGVDRRPDRLARRLLAGERVEVGVALLRLDHRLHRHVDLQVERLARAGVDDRARALRADEEAPDLLERVLRRGEPDPLHVMLGLRRQPLEREREMRAALGLRDGVDLVDDHLLDLAEDLPRLAREHQVERLGRRDEDVGRVAHHVAPLLLRRVARCGCRPARRRRSRAAARAGSSPRRRRAP